MANLVKLIGVYRLGDKNVHIFPLSEIKDYQINAENVYKITTYFGEKTRLNISIKVIKNTILDLI